MSGWSKIPTFHWHLHVVPPKNKSVTLPESISWSPDVTRPIGRPDAVSVQGCCRGKRSHRKCRHVPHELMVKATTSSMLDMTWLVKKPVFVGEFPVHPRLTLTLISHKYIYIYPFLKSPLHYIPLCVQYIPILVGRILTTTPPVLTNSNGTSTI